MTHLGVRTARDETFRTARDDSLRSARDDSHRTARDDTLRAARDAIYHPHILPDSARVSARGRRAGHPQGARSCGVGTAPGSPRQERRSQHLQDGVSVTLLLFII
jgi:hypothetical protein